MSRDLRDAMCNSRKPSLTLRVGEILALLVWALGSMPTVRCDEPAAEQHFVTWLHSLDEASELARVRRTPILVIFGAEWCGPCKLLDKEIEHASVQKELERWVPVHLDVDVEQDAAEKMVVSAIPVFVQLEAAFNTSPGALVGADAFKHTGGKAIKKVVSQRPRDQDRDNAQPSVITTQKGRESTEISIEAQLIPSGNSATPTEPDYDALLEAHFGSKHKCTAHTTTAAGSASVTLNLTAGGGAASGILAGDLIAVDVDATFGYEVRRVVSIATDVVTVNAAFSANPAISRVVTRSNCSAWCASR